MSATLEVHEPEVRGKVERVLRQTPLTPPPDLGAHFGEWLLESSNSQKRRKGWATIVSFVLQCLMIALVAIVPLMFTESLPRQQLLTFLVAPPPPPPPPPPPAAETVARVVREVQTNIMDGQLRSPSRIPQKVQMIREEEAPPPLSSGEGVIGGVPGGIPGGQLGGVIGGIVSSTSKAPIVPKLAVVVPKRVRISQGVTVGLLVRKIEPEYPYLARQARIQGDVVLTAIISREGTIENLHALSGHPLLIPAAVAAVQQWRYRPFLVSGQPVEVETQITVTFRFAG